MQTMLRRAHLDKQILSCQGVRFCVVNNEISLVGKKYVNLAY